MSFAGFKQFNENLLSLMETKTFKESSDTDKWELGYRLLNSKYGKGNFLGFGKVLPMNKEKLNLL